MFIDNGAIRLHVKEDGDPDRPPIVLLHGVIASHRTWDWIVPLLSDRYRVLRLDFRGHGTSDSLPSYELADYVTDAVAVCEQVAGQPCPVIGHSLGGLVALSLAKLRPDLVSSLVLEDPPYVGGSEEVSTLREGFRMMRERLPEFQQSGISPSELAKVMAGRQSPAGPPFGELLYPDSMEAAGWSFLHVDPRVLDGVVEGRIQKNDVWTQEVSVPTLLLAADPASPDAATRNGIDVLRASSPNAEVHVLEGATHLIHEELTQRQKMLDLILDFLQRV